MVSLDSGLCLLVAICHPVLPLFINKYPEINSEHSWNLTEYPEILRVESYDGTNSWFLFLFSNCLYPEITQNSWNSWISGEVEALMSYIAFDTPCTRQKTQVGRCQHIFYFIRQNIVFWRKKWCQDHWNGVDYFDTMVIYQTTHCQFSLHSPDISFRDNGFSDFHTLLPWSLSIRAIKTKRELMDCHTRRKYLAQIKKTIVNDCFSRNGCIINTTEPIEMIFESFFSVHNVLSDWITICHICHVWRGKMTHVKQVVLDCQAL